MKRLAMKTLRAISLTGLLLATTANADDRIGNGGDAVVCRDANKQITSARLLDYFEGDQINSQVSLGAASLSVRQKIDLILDRVSKFFPDLAKQYGTEAEILVSAAEVMETGGNSGQKVLFTGAKLVDIPDSDNFLMPDDCSIEQLVVRVDEDKRAELGGYEYWIQKDIWSHLDNDNRAGILNHEVLYKYATTILKQPNSRKARALNRILSSPVLDSTGFVTFAVSLANAGYPKINNENLDISTTITTRSDGLYMAEGYARKPTPMPYKVKFILPENQVFDANGVVNTEATRLANPQKVWFSTRTNKEVLLEVSVGDQHCRVEPFKDDGSVASMMHLIYGRDMPSKTIVDMGEGFTEVIDRCEFNLPRGTYNYSITISKPVDSGGGSIRSEYLVFDYAKANDRRNRVLSSYGLTPPELDYGLPQDWTDRKITKKRPIQVTGVLTVE